MYIIKENNNKIWFHGSEKQINNWTTEFTGKGTDQEGAGIYFTTDIDDSKLYLSNNGKGFIHQVLLNSSKILLTKTKPNKLKLKQLILKAPNYKETLENWDENIDKATEKALDGYLDYSDTMFDAIKSVEGDFYRNEGKSYCNAIVSIGYDYVIIDIKYKGILHAVVWNSKIINLENIEKI